MESAGSNALVTTYQTMKDPTSTWGTKVSTPTKASLSDLDHDLTPSKSNTNYQPSRNYHTNSMITFFSTNASGKQTWLIKYTAFDRGRQGDHFFKKDFSRLFHNQTNENNDLSAQHIFPWPQTHF